ncbi:MAG TPA: nitroreductase [Casimicrobiaceae bacterium]|nr:nitroreductase [Casimicrobiaceae bacterium]
MLELVLTRQSPLALRAPGPDEATLRAMLGAAMCAPDHGRLAPWRFVVIEGDGRHALGRVLRGALRRHAAESTEAALAREEAKALRAPTVIVVAAQVLERKSIPAVEQVIAAGIAAYNVLLAAHAFGLGGMWRTGAAAYDPEVRQALGFGADTMIVGFLYLGTPDAMPRPRGPIDFGIYVTSWPRPHSA